MSKPNLVIFEGISGSGKSTLEDGYRQMDNYKDYTIHRFTPSKFVYGEIFDRKISLSDLFDIEDRLGEIFNVFFIFCCCPEDIAYLRKVAMEDDNVETTGQMKLANALFLNYLSICNSRGIRTMWLDTSTMEIETAVKIVYDFVQGNYLGGKSK